MKGKDEALKACSDIFPSQYYIEGSEDHLIFFSHLMSGTPPLDQQFVVTNRIKDIFQVQVLKDSSMAYKIFTLFNVNELVDIFVVAGR